MFGGFPSVQPPRPYRQPCKVLPSPHDDKYCGKPSGEQTALDIPICDECWSFIRDDA